MTLDNSMPLTTSPRIVGIVDIGNTCVKIGVVARGLFKAPAEILPLDGLPATADRVLANASHVIIGCSGQPALAEALARHLRAANKDAVVLSRDMKLPFRSNYAAGQAGIDRLANVAAAAVNGQPAIIIDAGSAITVDAVSYTASGADLTNKSALFLGGAILPGLAMQTRALHARTAALPLITASDNISLPGTHTAAAISGGVAQGCLGAVDRIIQLYKDLDGLADARVLITGGDGAFFAEHLVHAGLIYDPLLTLRGFYALGLSL